MEKVIYNLVFNRKKLRRESFDSGRGLSEQAEEVFFNKGLY